jgi:thiol-disulfide isomerase/thioredoxin
MNSRSIVWTALALLGIVTAVSRAQGQDSKAPPGPRAGAADDDVLKALDESWPEHPEWLDMLTDILQDAPMSANYGWFRTAVAQTRYGWDATRARLDRDKDGRIARQEFSGSDADFRRLDRDRDGALTERDFDFSGSALASSPGAALFYRMDRDGNGKVTREELEKFFQASDTGNLGFLSLAELQEMLPAPPPPGAQAQAPAQMPAQARAAASAGRPTKAMLVRGLFKQEIGSLQPGPKLDDSAPDFTLKTSNGKEEITLSKVIGPKPVVLIFGNFTCGPFRSQAGNIEKLYQRYKDRASFVMVYVREAHPTDGWRMESNDRVGVATAQPRTYDERAEVARSCGRLLGLGFPMLVDTIDDKVGAGYSGMPGRLYVIDREGKVAYKSGRGPYLFKPAELEHSLILLLQDEAAGSGRTAKVSSTAAGSAVRSKDSDGPGRARP